MGETTLDTLPAREMFIQFFWDGSRSVQSYAEVRRRGQRPTKRIRWRVAFRLPIKIPLRSKALEFAPDPRMPLLSSWLHAWPRMAPIG